MKSLYYLTSILLVGSISAAEKSEGNASAAQENKSVYSADAAPKINFELINKSATPIALYVANMEGDYYMIDSGTNKPEINPEKIGGGYIALKSGDTFAATVDLDKATGIQIGRVVSTGKGKYPSNDVEKYSINAGKKTRYVSYNASNAEGRRLYPQTGPMMGAGKVLPNFVKENVTNSGLLKRNNVIARDIISQ
jgi:hypothetical protein